MAKLEISGENLVIKMQGSHKIWSLKSELEIPLEHVERAAEDPAAWKNAPRLGEKRMGTDLYGFYFAGVFVRKGSRIFYDLKHNEKALVIELRDEHFSKIIVGAEDPTAAAEMINSAKGEPNATKL